MKIFKGSFLVGFRKSRMGAVNQGLHLIGVDPHQKTDSPWRLHVHPFPNNCGCEVFRFLGEGQIPWLQTLKCGGTVSGSPWDMLAHSGLSYRNAPS